MSILLDTTVLIDVLRGRPRTIERLRALRRHGDVPFTTPINVEEIHRGLRETERVIAKADANGWTRQSEMNARKRTNLVNIITALEETHA